MLIADDNNDSAESVLPKIAVSAASVLDTIVDCAVLIAAVNSFS